MRARTFSLPRRACVVALVLADALDDPRLERAIGVLYLPETERGSRYFEATLPEQFDFVIHLDRTTAVRPIDPPGDGWRRPLGMPKRTHNVRQRAVATGSAS